MKNIDKEENKNIEETIELSNIPSYVENINNIRENEDWKLAKEYNQDEDW